MKHPQPNNVSPDPGEHHISICPPKKPPQKNRKQPTSSSKFINITNSSSFDSSTKTQVRVEVMRDYHRRRTQHHDLNKPTTSFSSITKPPDPVSQITKFRFGPDKGLTPWKPLGKRRRKGKSTRVELEILRAQGDASSEVSDAAVDDLMLGVDDEYMRIQELNAWYQDEDSLGQWMEPEDGSWNTIPIVYNPSAGILDPFLSTSLLITPRIELLLHHYFTIRLRSSLLMMPMRKSFFNLSIHDPAVFYTFLSHYAGSYHSHMRTRDTVESMFYRAKAIELVNARLQGLEGVDAALSDGTVAAVANMAIFDSSNGEKDSMLVHLRGLRMMVEMRGGLIEGGFSPHVQRLIAWTDSNTANILSQKPYFPTLNLPQSSSPFPESKPRHPQFQSPHFPSKTQDALTTIIHTLRTLTTHLSLHATTATTTNNNPFPNSNPQSENLFYSDQIYLIQRRLIDLSHKDSNSLTTTINTTTTTSTSRSNSHSQSLEGKTPATQALALALLIYTYRYLRDIAFTYSIMHTFILRLRGFCEGSEVSGRIELLKQREQKEHFEYTEGIREEELGGGEGLEDEEQEANNLFWSTMIGAIASEGRKEEYDFFIGRLRGFRSTRYSHFGRVGNDQEGERDEEIEREKQRVTKWKEARKVLRSVLWSADGDLESELDIVGRRVWVDVEGAD